MIGDAVAVQIFAVEVFSFIAELLPSPRHSEFVAVFVLECGPMVRVREEVTPVVHDLAVMVVGDHVFPASVFKQRAWPRQHVLDVPFGETRIVVVLVVGNDVVPGHQVPQPPGGRKGHQVHDPIPMNAQRAELQRDRIDVRIARHRPANSNPRRA